MALYPQQPQHPEAIAQQLAELEARLARVEAQLQVYATAPPHAELTHRNSTQATVAVAELNISQPEDAKLERELGQSAFTLAGVIALISGLGFLLSLPHANLPPAAPGVVGIAFSSALLVIAHVLRKQSVLLGGYVRGAAMLLLYFSVLRVFYFGRQPALDPDAIAGRALLVIATLANATIAWRSRSQSLVLLVLLMACATGLIFGGGVALICWLPLIATAAVLTSWRWNWPALLLVAVPLTHATYFIWAIGNPILRGSIRYVGEQPTAPGMLIAVACIFAAGCLYRPGRDGEDGSDAAAALLNCIIGYASMLVHTAAAYAESFVALHAAAFVVFLSVAVLFWTRVRGPISTFFYSITAYVALSMAIIKAAPSPDVFVWLSGQSLVVLATAIWFRSRLIVVANFLIYAVTVLGYVFFVKRESGVSVGFGVVALVSARMLSWQQARLELKTGLMRNAYLLSAFLVFPYALYHLAAARFVALSWVGLAVGYYVLNRIVRNQKYRWMGHATLALTAIFLVFARAGTLEPAWRIASFLALGTVLLIVSLTFRNSPSGSGKSFLNGDQGPNIEDQSES